MIFRTEVALPPCGFRLDTTSHVLLLGSCFAESVGERLQDALPDGHVAVNPCGVLYNPASVAQALRLLMADEATQEHELAESLFMADDGRWHSWLMSTKFTGATREECLQVCLDAIHAATQLLGRTSPLLIITLGTDHCYVLRDDGRVVANCHKVPAARFSEEQATLDTLQAAISTACRRCEGLHVVLTVSPYRYAKYGYHESQLSKSRLLVGADAIVSENARASYFPAYEIVLDELRDYRFYAADMLHPSEQAADYIYERFAAWCFTPELTAYAKERERTLRRLRHRPIV